MKHITILAVLSIFLLSCSTQSYQSEVVRTYQGRALCIVQSTGETGAASIHVEMDGMDRKEFSLEIK